MKDEGLAPGNRGGGISAMSGMPIISCAPRSGELPSSDTDSSTGAIIRPADSPTKRSSSGVAVRRLA